MDIWAAAMRWLILAELIIGHATFVWAEDSESGRSAYFSNCAPCHGVNARGHGFLNSLLKVPAPDLTTLAKRNRGVFPFAAVTEIVEGRTPSVAHGTRDVPVWGFAPSVRSQMPIIADFLSRLQVK
jgi:mono/diheme cytochrome c family protein